MSFQDFGSGGGPASRRGITNGKQDPTEAVAAGIFRITTDVNTFSRLVNYLGTPKDTPDLRKKLRDTRLHITQLVKNTSAKLKEASETDRHAEVSKNKKVTDVKLAKDFQKVLSEFQKTQRIAAQREETYAPFVSQATSSSYSASEQDISSDKTPEQQALLVESPRQDLVLLDNEIAFNEAIIEERDQGIHEIQEQIGEVNEIVKDLAVLVHDQGIIIDDVIDHIDNSQDATKQGVSHLEKAAKTQRSNSSLACLLLVIFGIVLIIVIIVLLA